MNISHPSAPWGRVNSQRAAKGRRRQWEDFKAAGFSGRKHTIQPNDFLPLCVLLYITQISGLSEQTSEMGEGWRGKKPSKTALCFSGMKTFSSIRFPRYLNNGLQWPIKLEEKISQYNSTQRIYSFSYLLRFGPFCLNFYYWNWWYIHWMSWGWKEQPLLEKRSSFQGPQTTNHFFFFKTQCQVVHWGQTFAIICPWFKTLKSLRPSVLGGLSGVTREGKTRVIRREVQAMRN